MVHRAVIIAVVILAATLTDGRVQPQAFGSQSGSQTVNRTFYFSGTPGSSPLSGVNATLDYKPPVGTTPIEGRFNATPITFSLPGPGLFLPTTVSEKLDFDFWLSSNVTTTVSVRGIFRDQPIFDIPTQPHLCATQANNPKECSFADTIISPRPLGLYSQVIIGVNATLPPGGNLTLLWGAAQTRSQIILHLSGYAIVDPVVDISDQSGRAATQFNLSATPGNNVVEIKAKVSSAFAIWGDGANDLKYVNVTIVDSSLRPVFNRTMSPVPTSPLFPGSAVLLVPYVAIWPYPPTSREDTYQVYIDIIDIQNNLSFSYRGPATFGLVIFSPLRQALNLLPYFATGGVGVVGGVFYYRRRKRKSYLVPFDYFSTLTGGELDGGTVVTVEGNTGSGKTLLCEELMYEDLKKGRPCVFVATGDFPSNIRGNMKAMGLDVSGYEQTGLLTFVDGYSAEAGQASREKFSIPSLGDLTTLGVKISSALPEEWFKGGSLYFDSLTPLASKAKPDSIVSFVHSVGARVRGMAGKAFFTVGPSVDASVQRQMEEMADCVVQMEAFEESGVRKSRLKISKFRARKHQEGWVIYTIEGGKGIIFYSKKPRK